MRYVNKLSVVDVGTIVWGRIGHNLHCSLSAHGINHLARGTASGFFINDFRTFLTTLDSTFNDLIKYKVKKLNNVTGRI